MLRSSRSRTTKTIVLTDQHIAESLSRAYVQAIAPLASMRLAIERSANGDDASIEDIRGEIDLLPDMRVRSRTGAIDSQS
jgi:hypothetical protein